MQRKYELVEEEGVSPDLFRIRALVDIPEAEVKKGEMGGRIASEANLSQEGSCWVFGDAKVFGDAVVSGNAMVFGRAAICDGSSISGWATIKGSAWISNSAVLGNALIDGLAEVSGGAISSPRHIFSASRVGRELGILTVYRNFSNQLTVKRGCFVGSIDEFIAASKLVHSEKMQQAYAALLTAAELMIELG